MQVEITDNTTYAEEKWHTHTQNKFIKFSPRFCYQTVHKWKRKDKITLNGCNDGKVLQKYLEIFNY